MPPHEHDDDAISCTLAASTTTHAHLYIRRDQNDNATYASTRWVPTFRHFLACEDVAGGSQQSGANHFFFARTHFLACKDVAGGSQQSGGRIVFFWTHFLACEGVVAGFQQSGGRIVFFPPTHFVQCKCVCVRSVQSGGESFFLDALPCVRRCSWWVPVV